MPTPPNPPPVRRRARNKSDGWQAEKSQQTRNLIFEATLQCLVEDGHARTTAEKIAKRGGVSRGAMMHHFKSTTAVITAAAKYITEKRADEFNALIAEVHVPPGALPSIEHMRQTVAMLRQYYQRPTFYALHELLHAARTDKNLKRVLAPLEKTLDKRISEGLLARFPYWAEIDETREVLMDLLTFSLQGVAVDLVPYLEGERLEHFCELLAQTAMQEFTRAYPAQASPAVRTRSRKPR